MMRTSPRSILSPTPNWRTESGPAGSGTIMSEDAAQKLVALLGLANRAGKLALGFSAVDKLVRRGQRPLVILASDIGASQLGKAERWEPVTGLVKSQVPGTEFARALGRDKLAMVAVAEPGFIKGILKITS